jgi:8-oxo-dGTP pyrophosphatase MutT (NUDIX family)
MTEFILKQLEDYIPSIIEVQHYTKIVTLIREEPRCFWRDCFPAHVTGSALLLNHTGDKVLLNHHKALDKWIQFGGHADGNPDIMDVAKRETEEEAGIFDFTFAIDGIFDVDTHSVPTNDAKGEPEHEHFDIRYLVQCTKDVDFKISDESVNLKWCNFDEAVELAKSNNPSLDVKDVNGMGRMLHKWNEWQQKQQKCAA